MKTKLEIVSVGFNDHLNENIMKMVGNVNSGEASIRLTDIECYIRCQNCLSLSNKYTMTADEGNGTLTVSEKGKMLIELREKEIHELTEVEADLHNQENVS